MATTISRLSVIGYILTGLLCVWPATVPAIDINGIQPVALDQPQVYALLERPDGALFTDSSGLGFAISGFLDTGASGVLLSDSFDNGVLSLPGTADTFGVGRLPAAGGGLVTFDDVGIGGSTSFNVSEALSVHLAPFHPATPARPPDRTRGSAAGGLQPGQRGP